ncbi:protein arginine kinase [Sporomusa acidovorans]|uniref:Protein-arginine kinase n=1 Tax=Sporomusa acidovorans (strain ATCC 49682 / DSM 3132 / Mol) TaxID=1123286 RepID=A0ABZ3IWN0_SPOA4|nr:protein arginine kinase [Sporomusa acidovorans]OZC13871.1 putative ATP:guanido phosphotransferase [Sporomusa acidovorans DSM 3132]SDF48532.1 protein arginine kinase [Sporomusa acidovorans]
MADILRSLLNEPLTPWLSGGGPEDEIVLSSRIRLARNLKNQPFPGRASTAKLGEIVAELKEVPVELQADDDHEYALIELEKISPLARHVLVEKHIISPNHAAEPENRALIVRDDAGVSIMVNEEDHLRLQCLEAGLNLTDAFNKATTIDDIIEAKHDLAFMEHIGYLTACPTNIGTGMRASVMAHLPALTLTKQMGTMVAIATQLGLTVRGLYGEGTEAAGNIFQISNQVTLGRSEQDIISNLSNVVKQIVDKERVARKLLLNDAPDALADRVWRAYGVLRYAQSLSAQEALALLSEVRLGIDLGVIDEVKPDIFNQLLVSTRPNFLQNLSGEVPMNQMACNKLRAQLVRSSLQRK